jgi:hypothetical protein
MNLGTTEDSASRLATYPEEVTSVIGHADRERQLCRHSRTKHGPFSRWSNYRQ